MSVSGHVLVVGGGIAGLALIRALGLHGVPCDLVERAPAPPSPGLGLNLPGNALRALGLLGLADAVISRGRRIRRREYRTRTGRLLFAVDEAGFWGPDAPSVCVRRGDLINILGSDGVAAKIRWGTTVLGVAPVGDRVRVDLGQAPSEVHDLVVGADGVHSVVRPAVTGAESRPSLMTAASWRFMINNPGVDCWTAWSGPLGTLLLIPADDTNAYGYASATRGSSVPDDPAWLASTFAGYASPVPAAIAAALDHPAELHYSPVAEVRCDRWALGRLVLIGDAAHAMGPVWAQGAALALEDALVLADLLGGSRMWSGVGETYEQRRRPRVTQVQQATVRMSRVAGLPTVLRDLVAPVVGPHTYRAAYGPLRSPPRLSPSRTQG
jgi:2-polyprenyl-6-methoxyphenol hydroxylase-like FAD-dependent oxidoreductase